MCFAKRTPSSSSNNNILEYDNGSNLTNERSQDEILDDVKIPDNLGEDGALSGPPNDPYSPPLPDDDFGDSSFLVGDIFQEIEIALTINMQISMEYYDSCDPDKFSESIFNDSFDFDFPPLFTLPPEIVIPPKHVTHRTLVSKSGWHDHNRSIENGTYNGGILKRGLYGFLQALAPESPPTYEYHFNDGTSIIMLNGGPTSGAYCDQVLTAQMIGSGIKYFRYWRATRVPPTTKGKIAKARADGPLKKGGPNDRPSTPKEKPTPEQKSVDDYLKKLDMNDGRLLDGAELIK